MLAPTSSDSAPTTAVSPSIATKLPKTSFAAPPVAVSWACWIQAEPELTKM
jgi:hypothetical protein